MVGLRATSSAVAALLVLLFLAAQARGSAPASGIQGQENLTLLPAALAPAAGDLPPSRACSSAPSCTDPAGRSLEAWLRWVGSSVSSFWASEFLNADGPDWRPARQLLVARGVTFRSHCDGGTTVRTSSSPSYCALDGATGTVYLPLGALRRHIVLPYGNFHHRDFVLSFIVAHEWAHHLQAFLGL